MGRTTRMTPNATTTTMARYSSRMAAQRGMVLAPMWTRDSRSTLGASR